MAEVIFAQKEAPEDPQDAADEPKGVDTSRILSFDDILAADDLDVRIVPIPEWKGSVRLRVLSAAEAIEFQKKMKQADKKQEAWIEIFALCAIDESGRRLFSAERQIVLLKKKSTAVFMRLQRVLLEMNAFAIPQKNWDTVLRILTEAGVESDVIARVEQRWREDDEAPLKNA